MRGDVGEDQDRLCCRDLPAACDGTFTHALPQLDSAAAVPAKGAEDLGQSGVNVLLGEDSTRATIDVTVPGGFEVMVLAQKGQVTFWSWQSTAKALSKVGASTYPYDLAKVGPPKATGAGMVLTGMVHAIYIVTSTFSGDGSGNSVAYTTGVTGWGAVKVASTTKLVPSGQGVALGGAGLQDEYKFFAGALEAASCSSTLPIAKCTGQSRVLAFWVWNSTLSQFTLDSTGGLK
ncbi:MAG: hypothetical protein DLM57_12350 [Pseudonocardiales bacterium]|nr:MAG: hypothetical protein DLM57_12350 [Pseudonocardiales bacterium]